MCKGLLIGWVVLLLSAVAPLASAQDAGCSSLDGLVLRWSESEQAFAAGLETELSDEAAAKLVEALASLSVETAALAEGAMNGEHAVQAKAVITAMLALERSASDSEVVAGVGAVLDALRDLRASQCADKP